MVDRRIDPSLPIPIRLHFSLHLILPIPINYPCFLKNKNILKHFFINGSILIGNKNNSFSGSGAVNSLLPPHNETQEAGKTSLVQFLPLSWIYSGE
jgi:hypothetical protein